MTELDDTELDDTELDGLAGRYVEEFAALDPCLAALMGIAGQDARLTDYGPDGVAARADLSRRTLAALGGAAAGAGEAGRIAAAVLRERLEVEVALDEAGVREGFLDTTDGPVQRLRMAVELLDRGAGTDWEAVHARMRALPAALAGLRVSLERACARGSVAARRQVLRNARECGDVPAYLVELAGRYGDGPLAGALGEAARAASAALAEFASFLSGEVAARAPERDALGADRYRLGVRDFLGTELDLAETYAWGWEELARIEAEMAAAAAEILPGEPLPGGDGGAGRRPRVPDRGRGGVPGVDPGAGGPGDRGSGRGALRHPRAAAADRVPDLAGGGGDLLSGARRRTCRVRGRCGGRWRTPPPMW
ncbi:DUF885 domain-containing protein [Actinomadura madurae]|nr:DUF885 domain-containing protein [Actinomadura madurae]